MKIILSKDDVIKIICQKYDIEITYIGGEIIPKGANIYWEGNPEE